MIASFADAGTKDIFDGRASKAALKKLNMALHPIARRKLDMINAAHQVDDLRIPPGNSLEKLKGDLAGKWSIRINQQYRIVFGFDQSSATEVEITDYH